ncbi:MAG TPA: hypothetical protein VN203_20115, partial [Candidatus Acidoferrum sp.]|nr:hypothetical protein [Candidatus Acidoferrum sp.]
SASRNSQIHAGPTPEAMSREGRPMLMVSRQAEITNTLALHPHQATGPAGDRRSERCLRGTGHSGRRDPGSNGAEA